jgi:hypothetical protein
MGLLDEAIREHLELKRRRGADPGEVARAERAALAPVFEEVPVEAHDESAPEYHDGDGGAPAYEESHLERPAAGEPQLADFGSPGQETAEIDMRAVLEEDHHDAPAAGSADEDGLAWEMPARGSGEGPPEQVPGQERLSFE